MRKIRFTFFLICASMMAFAQLPKQYLGLTTNLVEVRNTLKIDSSFVLPLRDTTFPTGQTVYNEGGMVMKSGVPYYHNGTKWNAFGGIFDSTSLSNRINERVKYTDSVTTFVTPTMLNDTANAIRNDFPILPSMYYQTVQANAVSATQRQRLNFGTQFSATDNGGNTSTDIAVTSIAQNIVVGLTDSLNTRVRYTDTTAMLNPYLRKVDTSTLSNRINLKANIASPTFTGTVTIPSPFTLGATSVITTGNQLNFLSSVSSTTGITSTNLVFSNGPTLQSPFFVTPNIGVATATSINTGTTLNGTIFAKSNNLLSLASTNHALTVGGEASGVNFAIGLYSSNCAIQARNNGTAQSFYINPLGGNVFIGDGSLTGQRTFGVINTGSGTTDISSVEVRSGGGSANDALKLYAMGASYTSSGILRQDYGVVATGTTLSGLSIGTQASAPIEFYTSNTQRWVLDASGNTIITGKFTSSGGGLGYSTGAGGTFTQSTSRATAVTLNKLCGTITMFSAAQAADAVVQFTLNNSFLEAGDYLMVQHIGNTPALVAGSWNFSVTVSAGSAVISVRNVSNSSITEATPLRITIIKSTTN